MRYAPSHDLCTDPEDLTPYDEGQQACIDGIPREQNPYFHWAAEERAEWDMGWDEAHAGGDEPEETQAQTDLP